MKRIVGLPGRYAGAGSLLLMLSVFFLAGCSGGDAGGTVAAKYGVEPSEFIALKKAAKNHGDLQKALVKKKIEKLQEQGAVVATTPLGKKTNKPH